VDTVHHIIMVNSELAIGPNGCSVIGRAYDKFSGFHLCEVAF
jgi:hypothetical protein